ncbi:protein NDNF isoform X2 [Microcaecilia unicolor]|nr:protein NDNF-like isoform X2 [Microcaecilia unicolor]XP_030060757.1 protein NDNF-like isoform X2 [Microcaecilia unicolor]
MSRLWVYLLLVIRSVCQPKMPPLISFRSNLFNHYHPLILPDEKETVIHLLKDTLKSYYCILEPSSTPAPFTITVTPCDVPIEWSVLHYKAPLSFRGKTYQSNDQPGSPESQMNLKTVSTLFHSQGNSVETYVGMSSYPDLFMLEFLSRERDTHITVYFTTDTRLGHLFPELPLDPRIDIIGTGHTTITLTWQPSPSILYHKENIHYCLLVNQRHNYKSLCAAETAFRYSEGKETTPLASSLFPYVLDPQLVMIGSSKALSIINTANNEDVRQICVGPKNTYTVSSLSPNTQYYFDVFVVNLVTNSSAAYTGTFAKTLKKLEPKFIELKEGKTIQLHFIGKKQRIYSLRYQAKQKAVHFTFQSCKGKVWAQIFKNGKILISESFEGFKSFALRGKLLDLYLVQLKSAEESSSSSVKVQVSFHFYKPLFPLLPESLRIKTFNKLRTCNSITIAWLGTQERSKYCVYRKKLKKNHMWKEVVNSNHCPGPEARHKSEKVLCKYFHDINLQKAVTTETIMGLEAGSRYLFDVYLLGSSGIPIRYHSKVVKTRKKC